MKIENFLSSIFNFESNLEYKKMSFSIPILKWKLNGTFGARIMKRFFNLQMNRQVKIFLHVFKFYFVGKNNEWKMKNKFNQISNSFSHHFRANCRCYELFRCQTSVVFLIVDWAMKTVRKKRFFSSATRKKVMIWRALD